MIEEWKIWHIYERNTKDHKKGDILWLSNYGRIKLNNDFVEPILHFRYLSYKRPGWIHRGVASLFVPNPDNKPVVDHIDGNRLNNRADNLRWVTQSENNLNPHWKEVWHMSEEGKENIRKNRPRGEKHPYYHKTSNIKNRHRQYNEDGSWKMVY